LARVSRSEGGSVARPRRLSTGFQGHRADRGWRAGIFIAGVEDAWRARRTVDGRPDHKLISSIVLEIAFGNVDRSPRHRSGVATPFQRLHRIRWDKPFREADTLETLERMMT
jgi:ATP-dependent DNA ligase